MNGKNKCLELNEVELKKLHKDLLSLLVEFDRICKKYDIKYFLSDGTLLGAVRHRGFIPWDDDVDVQMSRVEYDRFCEVCKHELDDSRYFFQNQETDEDYNWVYGKLRLKNTTYMRVGQEHLKQDSGIFMDIFPLDNAPSSEFIQYIFENICNICRKILWSPVGLVTKENLICRLFFKMLSFIPRKVTINVFNFFAKFYNNKESKLFAYYNLPFRYGKRQVLEKELFDEIIDIEFEGYRFCAPKKYDKVLSLTYGDYMEFPPKDKRRGSCPSSYIKFSDGTEVNL